MASLTDVIDYLDDVLDAHGFEDYGPNGLQVSGAEQVQTVVSGVSAQTELFERAAAREANLVLVHHGLFWHGAPTGMDAILKRRLKLLFDHDMSLAAYHLPLDGHPQMGNNALIAAALQTTVREGFAPARGRPIGIVADFCADGLTPGELFDRVAQITGRVPLTFPYGPARVRSIGILSGGGAAHIGDAADRKLDAFLTGEPTERVMGLAREHGLHFIAAGHYATETFGVRALGEQLVRRFGVTHEFVDIPNPV